MSKYKKIMFDKGIMQKEVLDKVRCTDPRIDKSLLSKIVNDICLPTPPALACICKSLGCDVLDVYDVREIQLVPPERAAGKAVATATERTRRRRASNDFYNLTVEIPRDLAERVFSKNALRKLGYLSKSDCVRRLVEELDAKLSAIAAKENAADGAGAPRDGKE